MARKPNQNGRTSNGAGKIYESLASKNSEALRDQLLKSNVDWSDNAFSEIGSYYTFDSPVKEDKWDNGSGNSKKLEEALEYARGLYRNESRFPDSFWMHDPVQYFVGDTTLLNLEYFGRIRKHKDSNSNPYIINNQGSTYFGAEQEYYMRQALKQNENSREAQIGVILGDDGIDNVSIGSPVFIREVTPLKAGTFTDSYFRNGEGRILYINKLLFGNGGGMEMIRMSNSAYLNSNFEKRKTVFRQFTTQFDDTISNDYNGPMKYVDSEYMGDKEKHASFFENMTYTEGGKKPQEGDNLWNTNDHDLLYKTNEIIAKETSGTTGRSSLMIRRFFDSKQYKNGNGFWSSETDAYGLSHGRNLLKENGSRTSEITVDGYLNPYCRVWTKSKPYDKVSYRIRPFYKNNKPMTYSDLEQSEIYNNFRNPEKHFGQGWGQRLDAHGSIGPNGYVNITPYADDAKKVKNCMFSIENLAWKGSTSLLSNSQIGPRGGRIMWFPPYGLTFDERTSASWKSHEFIGRGEPIFTYTNTRRSGTLSFIILADYPSILNNIRSNVSSNAVIDDKNQNDAEYDIQRYFAGCDTLEGKISTNGGGNGQNNINNPQREQPHIDFPNPNADNIKTYAMRIFFPNDYSGSDDDAWGVLRYLASGVGTTNESSMISTLGANGYEMNGTGGISKDYVYVYCDENSPMSKQGVVAKEDKSLVDNMYSVVNRNGNGPTGPDTNGYYYGFTYRVDKVLSTNVEKVYTGEKPYHDYVDDTNFNLNTNVEAYGDTLNNSIEYLPFSLLAVDSCDVIQEKLYESLRLPFKCNEVASAVCCGYASWHSNKKKTISPTNERLATQRGNTAAKICKDILGIDTVTILDPQPLTNVGSADNPVNSIDAKKQRMAEIRFYIKTRETKATTSYATEAKAKDEDMGGVVRLDDIMAAEKGRRYDDEYKFFEAISEGDNPYLKELVQKVRYFNPAYHSITPEGLNARLTFLNQCLRQGPTHAAATKNYWMAENLPFGRPPICILRIGDFFNTEIVINDLNIIYDSDGVRYDMNQEGIGLQPMYAKVTLSFDIIGGSDLGGPIAKLQNAVSFNYYANTSVYDDRADVSNGTSISQGKGIKISHTGNTDISNDKNEKKEGEE